MIGPLENNGRGGSGGIDAKEKGGKEGLCQGAKGKRRTGEAEGSSTGGEKRLERAIEGEWDEEGMEGVKGLERGR